MGRSALKQPRIKTLEDAIRCVLAIQKFLYEHESPLAAEDLDDAITLFEKAAAETH